MLTRGDRRSLEFKPGMIQSEMRLSRPDQLVLRYARAMMCFALFNPQPRHIVMVGLGGGSLAKFCHRHFPSARITVLELRADVIALRDHFMIPPDDARFRVIHTDAVTYIRRHPGSADVLLVDGFDESGLPPALGSARFYADCRRALVAGGVLAANIFSYDPHYAAMLDRLEVVFRRRVCALDGIAGNNHIIFAVRQDAGAAATRAGKTQRLLALRRRVGLHWLNRILVRLLILQLSRRR
ncbi:putative Spermidine synthase [Janthinobacterium agaricidamnosum NBRC 102515 = DSM 9628]|uniref:Putative Spermidine synthase n=2 Tax=Janthinobacterium agaricidamnosum TaxID=55508 RepID=W0V8A4_9BURK|nr:putative Spermidine synthase [Janthinobacterium agaricidamnosum NBRC 102515 = DSM 9628]